MNSVELLAALRAATQFQPAAAPVGNLSIGSGMIDGTPTRIAIVESKIASGSLGVAECAALAQVFDTVAKERGQLVLYLDSAGARVSEGLAALGAFRRLVTSALRACSEGVGFQVVLGANCFGGASMLAALATHRVFASNTRLAMSGPSILAQTAGVSALDEMFQAMATAAIGAEARVKIGGENVGSDRLPLAKQARADTVMRHRALKLRIANSLSAKHLVPESVQRKDLSKLYPLGYELSALDGVLSGAARSPEGQIALVGLLGRQSLTASRAWRLADHVLASMIAQPRELHVLVECESHATSLDDERVMLSSFIVDVAAALQTVRNSGCAVVTRVLTTLGGGVYVALAAPATRLELVHGAQIQVLPGKAIASILGASDGTAHDFNDYRNAGVAEVELKLGIV